MLLGALMFHTTCWLVCGISTFRRRGHRPNTVFTMSEVSKHNFWSKVRSSTNKLSSSLANLSLRTEHDGDTPETTLVHKAIAKHFRESGQRYPEWLGVVDEPHQQRQQQQQSQSQQQEQPRGQQADGRRPSARPAASASFKDMYSRPATAQQPQPMSSSRPRMQWGASAPQMQTQSQPQLQPQGGDEPKSSQMRDRLKRNNYRSNFV